MDEKQAASRKQTGDHGVVYKAALSTMWTVVNCANMADAFNAAAEMGFAWVELNHSINSSILNGLDLEKYPVSSIHEPCPADISMNVLRDQDWLPTSPDEEKRRKGVRAIKNSLDLAHRLGVSTIVMHCGQVQTNGEDEKQLRRLFRQGLKDTPEFRSLRDRMIDTRAGLAAPYFRALKRSVLELLEHAGALNVRIGLENRYHYTDMPLQDEMEELLEMGDAAHLGFIYDVGHGQTLDRLGFLPHEDWLKRFSARMFGVHLHDVRGVDDHWPPGMGEVDYGMVARYLPETAFRTCEIHGKHSAQEIMDGLKVLEGAGIITRMH
jgi:sugar phosphate isomerase/epimerase